MASPSGSCRADRFGRYLKNEAMSFNEVIGFVPADRSGLSLRLKLHS